MSDDLEHSIRETPEPEPLPGPPLPEAPEPEPIVEIIGPTAATLRDADSSRIVMAALTSEALWIQETYRLRKIPLRDLAGTAVTVHDRTVTLLMQSERATERLELTFSAAYEVQRWKRELEAGQLASPAFDGPPASRGVALVKKAPDTPQQFLGTVQFLAADRRHADRGVQLRAGMLGADAVVGIERRRRTELGVGGTQVSGTAVRIEDPTERRLVRYCWFGEEVKSLVNRALLILAAQMVLTVLSLDVMRYFGWSGLSRAETLADVGQGFGIFYGWPLLLLGMLRVLKWPQLLRPAGLAMLAATLGRWLTVIIVHAIAKAAVSNSGPGELIISLADPVNLVFALLGVWNCRMSWRLASEARFMLPQAVHEAAAPRWAWSRAAMALSAVMCVAMLGYVGVARYRVTSYGDSLDPRREAEALQALNEGVEQAKRNDRAGAEISFQRSLRIWDILTAKPSAPVQYHLNKAQTLYNLGWLAQTSGRIELAESYYARALQAGEPYADRPEVTNDFRNFMAEARRFVANVREFEAQQRLEEKDKLARRKYEEATVKGEKGAPEAEALLREAIAIWEEILPKAQNPDYVKAVHAQLGHAYLVVGVMLMDQNKNGDAARELRQSIDHGEKALKLDPDRPLIKHNLDVARQALEQLRKRDG